jgi:hypothetical protein
MKKLILVVLFAAVVVLGIYYLSREQADRKADNFLGLKTETSTRFEAATLPEDSFLRGLNSDLLVLWYLKKENCRPLIELLSAYQAQLAQTKIWKKLAIDEHLRKLGMSQREDVPWPAELEDLKIDSTGKSISDFWSVLNEIVIAASTKTFSPSEDLEIPFVLAAASFSDGVYPKRFEEFIEVDVLKEQNSVEQKRIRLSKDPDQEQTYNFSVKFDDSQIELPGTVQVSDLQIVLVLGTDDIGVFTNTEGSELFVASEQWKKLGSAVVKNFATISYSRGEELQRTIEKLILSDRGTGKKQPFPDWTVWKGWKATLSSVNFFQGMNSKQCVAMESGSKFGGWYKSMVKEQSGWSGQDRSVSPNLITDRTIAAFRFSSVVFRIIVDYVSEHFRQLSSIETLDKEVSDQLRKQYEYFSETVKEWKFKEFGVVVNTQIGNIVPEVLIYFGGWESEGKQILEKFKNLVEGLLPEEAKDLNNPVVAIKEGVEGRPRFELSLPPVFYMRGGVIAGNAVVFTNGMLPVFKKGIKPIPETFLGRFTHPEYDLQKSLSESFQYVYLNTVPVLEMAKPYLGFWATSFSPDQLVEVSDLEELFVHLSGRIFAGQKIIPYSEEIYCLENTFVALRDTDAGK